MATTDSVPSSQNSSGTVASIAFYPFRGELRFPRNNREYYLSQELSSRGWEVHWLRPHGSDDSGVPVEWPIIRLAELDHRGRRFFYPLYLALKLRAADIDVLWLSGWTIRNLQELHWTIRAAQALGVRVVYDPIDPICQYEDAMRGGDDPEAYRRCAEKAREVYSACDLVTCVTPEVRDVLIENGAPADRLVVARWGTDAELFAPDSTDCDFKERLGLSDDDFLVGWLGTMDRFKGLEDIMLPLARRMAETRSDVHFVVAGKGPLKPELEDWSENHPEVPFTVLGQIPYREAPNFTGSLDAYVVPTEPRSYGNRLFPVKCLDALAMEVPLITTRTPAMGILEEFPELVSLVEYDEDAFLDALLDLHRQDEERSGGHGSEVRAAIERRYSHQGVSVSVADAIEHVLWTDGAANTPADPGRGESSH